MNMNSIGREAAAVRLSIIHAGEHNGVSHSRYRIILPVFMFFVSAETVRRCFLAVSFCCIKYNFIQQNFILIEEQLGGNDMSMIKVENLTFSYPGSYDEIFENVSFQIDTDWKLGFIGRNGRGKTTFLKLLMGEYEYAGRIGASVAFDYFPYPVKEAGRDTYEILDEICPQAEDWQKMRELSLLQVDAAVLYQPFETLSGGEQTKILLAALFLREGNFLLIDEPTNHLDADARELVAAYLKKKKGFILVSHDRLFLDGCVDHILSINRADIEVCSGNFSSWLENFRRQQEFELAQNEKLKKEIGRLSQSARRATGWSNEVEATKYGTKNGGLRPDRGFIGHKSAKMMKRAKVIEARRQQAIEEKSSLLKNYETDESLKLFHLEHHARQLVSFADVSIRYADRQITDGICFRISPGERIALHGGNGSGKSSLLKLLLGEPIAHAGIISKASGLVISYVPQDTSHLCGNLSEYAAARGIEEHLFKALLRKLGFERVQFEKDLSGFSGGQKKKVLVAASLCEKAHLYIWDEPLNFIDLYSRMQIEQLILTFLPTMLFVEHDRVFQQKIATRVIEL